MACLKKLDQAGDFSSKTLSIILLKVGTAPATTTLTTTGCASLLLSLNSIGTLQIIECRSIEMRHLGGFVESKIGTLIRKPSADRTWSTKMKKVP